MIYLLLSSTADPGSWQWIVDIAGPILVAQAIAGLVGLVSLVVVLRKFLSSDFPAAMREVNGRLDTLHMDLTKLRDDLQTSKMDLARLTERHESLRNRVDRIEGREERLDETRSRRP